MNNSRPIHPDYLFFLEVKETPIIELFRSIRALILEMHPDSNELLYHTHALTSVFSISEKLSDAFCHIPIYNQHLNLGFNKGALLDDPHGLLQGTGKLIRHIPIKQIAELDRPEVRELIQAAIAFAIEDMDKPTKHTGKTISKIKRSR